MEKKHLVITGVSKGIGYTVFERFAQEGYNIWACARLKNEEIEKKAKQLEEKYDIQIHLHYFDLLDSEAVKENIKLIIKEAIHIDVLVNNAGISSIGLFMLTSSKQMQETMEINCFRPIEIAQLVAKKMIKQKKGVIINIASVSGVSNEKGGIAYGTSKAALIFASRTMALELGEYGVRVNCISPGFIQTDMWNSRSAEVIQENINRTPLKRQGSTVDISNLVAFLASDDASYITGQNYIVDGGGRTN